MLNYAFSNQLSVTNYLHQAAVSWDVPNIRFEFASVQNSAPNSVFVFGRIVLSERIRICMYSAASDVYGRLHSVSASCSCSDRLIMVDE